MLTILQVSTTDYFSAKNGILSLRTGADLGFRYHTYWKCWIRIRTTGDPKPCFLQLHKTSLHNIGIFCSVEDPGYLSRIRIKEFKYFNTKNCFKALENIIQGLVIPDPDLDFFTHP
jgi:hypothetical protein